MKQTTVVMTGGHVTPAVAVIDALKDDVSIVFFGRKYAMEGSRILSVEYRLITGKHIRFIPLITGRLQRRMTAMTIPSLLKIPVGCIQAYLFCLRERPSLVVSFGGYVAFPVAVAAWFCRIPVITHEQTVVAGLTNRIIARIATRICVTYPETIDHFPQGKAVYTGLPMREELFRPPKKAPYILDMKYPVLYVTGGGSGARSLNRLVFPVLPSLLRRYTVIHQVGSVSREEAQKIRSQLPDAYKNRYIIETYISLPALSWVLSRAVLVLGRSGANTVMELAALGKVAVLVPLPWSGGGEQQANASWLVRNGGAIILTQQELTPHRLEQRIDEAWAHITPLQSRADVLASRIPRDGTKRVVAEIEHILHSPA